MTRTQTRLSWTAALLTTTLTGVRADPVRLLPIALSDRPAAEQPDGVVYSVFTDLDMGTGGQVAFRSVLAGLGVTFDNDAGNFVGDPTRVSLLTRDGDQAAGLPEGVLYQGGCYICAIGEIPGPRINPRGRIALTTLLGGLGAPMFGSTGSALLAGEPGTLALVATTGDPVPGLPPGFTITDISTPTLAPVGDLATPIRFTGPGLESITAGGIIAGNDAAHLRGVALTGQQAVGFDAGFTYSEPLPFQGSAEDGRVAFTGGVIDPATSRFAAFGLWREGIESVQLVARTGQQAPGMPPGVNLAGINPGALNGSGRVLFIAFFDGTGITFGVNHFGLLSDRTGAFESVAQIGTQAAGLPEGNLYSHLLAATLSDTGRVAFVAFLNGRGAADSGDRAVFSDITGTMTKLARTGDPVPDLPPGAFFDAFDRIRINARNQVAFSASTTDVSVPYPFGLFLGDAHGRIQTIVRPGDSVQIAPADLRTVERISGFDLNDDGRLAAVLRFDDGSSGVFVTAPECPADIDGDGDADVADFFAFILAFAAGDPAADVNDDGSIDVGDFFAFVAAFAAGCP